MKFLRAKKKKIPVLYTRNSVKLVKGLFQDCLKYIYTGPCQNEK